MYHRWLPCGRVSRLDTHRERERQPTSSSGELDSMTNPSQFVTPAPITAALNFVFVCVTPQAVNDPPRTNRYKHTRTQE